MKIVASNNKAEIFLYGYIGDKITASEFMTTLRDLEGKYPEITLLINSGGGEMFEGLPLYNNLCLSPANIVADIQGLAASMITIVMCGAKKIRAASNAKIMIHGPIGGNYTNIEGLEGLVSMMKTLRADMAKVYAKRTGKTEQWVLDNWLTDGKEHWFTAQEAKAAGLIDEVYEVQGGAMPSPQMSLYRMAAFYDERLTGKAQGSPAPGPSDNNFLNQTEPSMKKIIAGLNGSKLVQIPETATEELVAESITTLVNQLKQRDQTIVDRDATLTAKDAEITRLTNELNTAKTAGLKKNGEALVAAAITAGKIVAAQKDNYEKLATASEEGYNNVKALFDSMQPYKSVVPQLNAGTPPSGAPVVYASLKEEFEKRAENGSLEQLKAENFEHFKAVYKAGTNKDFKG